MEQPPRLGVAIVTMGNRPREVDALLAAVAKQDVPPTRVVLVGNGSPLPDFTGSGLPFTVTTVELDDNLGCPGGRNVALARLRGFGDVDVAVELDDDGLLVDADVFRTVRDLYARRPAPRHRRLPHRGRARRDTAPPRAAAAREGPDAGR